MLNNDVMRKRKAFMSICGSLSIMTYFSVPDKGFEVISSHEREWCKLFADFIAGNACCNAKNCAAHSDDMLWYVSLQQIGRDFCISQEVSFTQVFLILSKQAKNSFRLNLCSSGSFTVKNTNFQCHSAHP